MSIRYIQTSYGKLDCDNILRFLLDLVVPDLVDVQVYEEGKVYVKGEFIYLKENNIHKIYRCKADATTGTFNPEDWEHAMDTYDAEVKTVCNLVFKDNSIIIDEENKDNIVIPDYKPGSSTIIFIGKDVFVEGKDFIVDETGKVIFKPHVEVKPGDKVVIESTESTGQPDKLVLLSDNGGSYEVGIIGEDIFAIQVDVTYAKNEVTIGDIFTGDNYKIYMIDEEIYYEEIDSFAQQTEIRIVDEEDNAYKLEMIDGELYFSRQE